MPQKAQEASAMQEIPVKLIPLDALDENPKNFFRPYTDEELRALAESIASSGPRENQRLEERWEITKRILTGPRRGA